MKNTLPYESYKSARLMVASKIIDLENLQKKAEQLYDETGDEYYYGKAVAYDEAIKVLTDLHAEVLFI